MRPFDRPPHYDLVGNFIWYIADELTRVRERPPPRPVLRRGKTLRPGPATPCWNALASRIAPLLQRRGAKAMLARELGLNRGRISEFFVTRTAMPDAERVLRLLEWHVWRLAEDRQKLALQAATKARNTSNR